MCGQQSPLSVGAFFGCVRAYANGPHRPRVFQPTSVARIVSTAFLRFLLFSCVFLARSLISVVHCFSPMTFIAFLGLRPSTICIDFSRNTPAQCISYKSCRRLMEKSKFFMEISSFSEPLPLCHCIGCFCCCCVFYKVFITGTHTHTLQCFGHFLRAFCVVVALPLRLEWSTRFYTFCAQVPVNRLVL